ncbi:PTS system N-acetylglucosamine-specific IIA component, Glc family /PTS system N-acetylglucosamine-specific IIB component, Glc family /PTS system N-acetylglucosamine-specific IIC component, Glc family [Halobacillus karajensis]|uniref:EIICBA-Glc n=1 Tax=Halobacillus karajensis TaxID=195088 RepID=A0A024P7Q6_9BACI|nr:N-acetylglucosamine-specific PTS transporter subunit IIBC [Halobacillus karajensis]CDQ21063.1 EIICBA-Glc [Halobacillus karajensis]CDQ24873.1 EIICBA-Glc [Halobacillus karajensis]CDQ28767.1 EIICBA-Glc [Halobacillus karajensis]SEH96701.1 PTS system N-acetylglucosamine-specific IIA component, Glc family /PTS system N-acetylglucosamine-specific IIB component, Glc family /PTS system N-acetylglucosamine-specific IIC component, Glc family [Halobacillus karajensis]
MLSFLQRIGKSLMFPIATLPAAALLVRLGMEDMLDIPFITAAGNGILENLALIFAIGIAMGFAKDGSGAAALAGAIGYLVLDSGIEAINADIDMGVFAGVIAGVAAGMLYNRYNDVKFPDFLSFFGGKRFVPIITSALMVVLSFVFGYLWVYPQALLDTTANWILNAGELGVGVYGVLNRLLIPVGLHHVMNALIWFDFGTFTTEAGDVVRGEINRFLNGDPSAGYFLAGFFPVMMFGLPAACLAMYVAAKKERKAAVGGMFLSIGLTSFITGVTEPIEFSFMFLSPLLYFVHALLTGVSMVLAFVFDVKHGFGFSAGLIDYLLNYNIAQNPFTLVLIGLFMGVIYFVVFYFLIVKLDLKTPGREEEDMMEEEQKEAPESDYDTKAYHYLVALGGPENIETLDYCTTRLRLEMKDREQINEKDLKRNGARGVMKLGKKNLQVIVGTSVEFVADAMSKRMQQGNMTPPKTEKDEESKNTHEGDSARTLNDTDIAMPLSGKVLPLSEVPDEVFAQGMMGPGFAIDPSEGIFHSPVSGKVIQVFPTKHAIGLEMENGLEVLIHVGLDTVKLDGEGFEALVESGQMVTQGTPLLRVDLEFVKENAPSIVTPIIFTNAEGLDVDLLKEGQMEQGETGFVKINN